MIFQWLSLITMYMDLHCSPYQAVTGKIYRLQLLKGLPKLNNLKKKKMRVVIRSDPHKKMNEYVEKYSYLSTKRTAQK